MKNRDKLKLIFVYLAVFYTVVGIVYLFFNQKFSHRKNFTVSDKMLYNYAVTDWDLCASSIFGDAQQSETSYFKVNFHCDKTRSNFNTLSLDVLPKATAGEAIKEVTRIIQFRLPDSWQCYYEKKLIIDYNQPIVYGRTIDCLAPGLIIGGI